MLEELIREWSDNVAAQFKEHRCVAPVWICFRGREIFYLPSLSNDKDLTVAIVKTFIAEKEIERYVFVDEAWTVKGDKGETTDDLLDARGSIKKERRVEVVILMAEDKDGHQLMATRRILRPPGKKPTLGPLEMMPIEIAEGRMATLFDKPPRGMRTS